MNRRKKIVITVIVLSILFIAIFLFSYHKNNSTTNIKKSSIASIYLYHSNNVGTIDTNNIDQKNKLFNNIVNEVLDVINNNDLCSDTVDGLISLEGNGAPRDEDSYSIEINFAQPQTLFLLEKEQSNICTLFFTLDNNCLYIYKDTQNGKLVPLSGYQCIETTLKKIDSLTKEYFNSNN